MVVDGLQALKRRRNLWTVRADKLKRARVTGTLVVGFEAEHLALDNWTAHVYMMCLLGPRVVSSVFRFVMAYTFLNELLLQPIFQK